MNKLLTFVAAAVTILGFTQVAWADGLSTQDYIDIEQLYATYNHAIDSGDARGVGGDFHAGRHLQQVCRARPAGRLHPAVEGKDEWRQPPALEHEPEHPAEHGRGERHGDS